MGTADTKKYLSFFFVGIVFLGVFFIYRYSGADRDSGRQTDTASIDQTSVAESGERPSPVFDAAGGGGAYLPYTSLASLQDAADNGPVVLFFHAEWCPGCRALHEDIQTSIDAIPSNLTIFHADHDTDLDLRNRYRITRQHTILLLDASLAPVKSWYGSRNLTDILDHVVSG